MSPYFSFMDMISNDDYDAAARFQGSESAPELRGVIKFYQTPYEGILVAAEIFGLPKTGFFGMHIHEKGDCTPPFDKTGNHYNPSGVGHPDHAGDMPPLLSNSGYAFLVFYDNRFTIEEIIGKSVIIHSQADDFTTQPSGNSGSKIGCGVIMRL